MIRREKLQQLNTELKKEIDLLYKKYDPMFKALEYKFSIEEIEADGWIKGRYYGTRGNKNEWEYDKKLLNHDFWTRTVYIIFEDDDVNSIREIIAGTPQRNICDMEDLNYYFENNK